LNNYFEYLNIASDFEAKGRTSTPQSFYIATLFK